MKTRIEYYITHRVVTFTWMVESAEGVSCITRVDCYLQKSVFVLCDASHSDFKV